MTHEAVPDIDDTPLLDGSLGFNREWQTYRAGHRFAGGAPITFKHTAQIRAAERALYEALGRDGDYTKLELRRAALRGAPALTDTSPVDADWTYVSEYARSKGIGPREARRIMVKMGLLQQEIISKAGEWITTYRLAQWAVEADFGKRFDRYDASRSYDMLSPDGVEWLDARWPEQEAVQVKPVGRPVSSLRDRVKTLMVEGKSQAEIARILGTNRQAIYRQVKALKAA